jgi:hypothetical protein
MFTLTVHYVWNRLGGPLPAEDDSLSLASPARIVCKCCKLLVLFMSVMFSKSCKINEMYEILTGKWKYSTYDECATRQTSLKLLTCLYSYTFLSYPVIPVYLRYCTIPGSYFDNKNK